MSTLFIQHHYFGFQWRIFSYKNVLKEMLQSENLSNFELTYGKWHEWARKRIRNNIKRIIRLLLIMMKYVIEDFDNLINGNSFRVSSGNGRVVIGELDEKVKTLFQL